MKTTLLFITLFLISISSIAQPNNNRIKSLKIAFITEKLNLTANEAQQFWPVYNDFEETMSKIKFEDLRRIRHEIKQNYETLSDAKANELLDRLIKAENELHNAKIEFTEKLKKNLSPQKIILLKVTEEEFNRKILEEMKKRRQGRMKKNRP